MEITTHTPEPIVYLSMQRPPAEVEAAFCEAMFTLFRYLNGFGIEPTGPPFLIHRGDAGDGRFAFDIGMPVPQALPATAPVESGELPGGPAAEGSHTGPYAGIPAVREALMAWIRDNGHEPDGPLREIYCTDPCENTNEAEWVTRIVQPIRG